MGSEPEGSPQKNDQNQQVMMFFNLPNIFKNRSDMHKGIWCII